MERPVGEQTGADMREDKNAYDESKLLDSISKNLANVEGLDVDPVEDSTPVEPDDTADDDDSTPPMPTAKKEAADDSDSTPEDSDDEPADDDTEEEDKPAIPDNYYRAAVHQGWTPEEIKDLYDANSELALKTLKKLYEDTNKVSQVFAQKGRLAAQQVQPQSQQQPQQQVVAKTQTVDMEKLKERYEDDPFGAMAELIKATVGQQPQAVVEAPQTQPTTVQDQNALFEQYLTNRETVSKFFNAKDMAEYNSVYGSEKDGLLPGHQANRQAVLEMADAIIDGMKVDGKEINIVDALTRAHLIVSAPMTTQIVRNKLVQSAKKREKGMTLRSSKSKTQTSKTTKGQKSDEQRVADAQERLNALSL